MSLDAVGFRFATPGDARGLARLKLAGLVGDPRYPSAEEEAAYAARLRSWMQSHADDVWCAVAAIDRRLIGMAWLVVFERVPNLSGPPRLSADIQSVWVDEEFRGAGVGGRLIDMVLSRADGLGIPRVIVHSSDRAVEFYGRHGFESARVLLQRETTPPQI